MKKLVCALGWMACVAFGLLSAAEGDLEFKVKGANPGGKQPYEGEVLLRKLSDKSALARWTTGAAKEVTEGVAIRVAKGLGAAYGGQDLFALAVYELNGKSITATWATAANPKDVQSYELQGTEFKGTLSIKGEGAGTVTFSPARGGVYDVEWQLPTGRYKGIGVRAGDILVAASGAPGGEFGVAAYVPQGNDLEGIWATTATTAAGRETWTLPDSKKTPASNAKAAGDGRVVEFGGESYLLKENKSAAGQATSELREYLREGETWESYSKMVAFHAFSVNAEPAMAAKTLLAEVRKKHTDSYVSELESTADSASVLFILVVKGEAELNLWNYRKSQSGGLIGTQFVLRNKPPYDSERKFKAEQDRNLQRWIRELKVLGEGAESFIVATGNAKPDGNSVPPELAKSIKADLERCSALARSFMEHLLNGDDSKAVELLGSSAFAQMTRDQYTEKLRASGKVLGTLVKYAPDKGATSFGVKDGVMGFSLEADAEYKNARVRETFRFMRNEKGDIEMVGYDREVKADPAAGR